jgi:hypothetical protein
MKKKKTKAKAKIAKTLVVKREKLADDVHLVHVQHEVHGPEEAIPALPAVPLEVKADAPPEAPEKHWHDFLTGR